MKHPLGNVALCYAGGLLLAEFFQPPLLILLGVSLAVAAAAILLARWRPSLLWPLLVLTGWTNLVHRTAIISPNDLRAIVEKPDIVAVRGVLTETPSQRVFVRDEEEAWRTLARVRVTEISRRGKLQPAFGLIATVTPEVLGTNYFAGQLVEVSGILAPPPTPIADGLFDYCTYLKRHGIYFQLKVASTNDWLLLPGYGTRRPMADRFLDWAQTTLARDLPQRDEPLELLWAMTLGWQAIDNEVYAPFMQTGTMHIFAISGLHIALIAGILVAVLRVLQVSRLWCGVVIVPLIWFYTAATGWQPSAIRSTIMMSVIIGGWALKRPSNLLNSLAAAALIILLYDPQQLFGASFQLSFFVVLSIALFLPPLQKLRDRLLQTDPLLPPQLLPRWQRWLRAPLHALTTALATSLAAWLGSWPLTAYYFHLFSPVTLLANLLIVPASSAALACNLGSVVCGDWLPWVTALFNHAAWFWMWLMVEISNWATKLPVAFVHVPSPALADFAIYYAGLFGVLSGWLLEARRRKPVLIGLAVLIGFYTWRWNDSRKSTAVTILPLSGGSAVFSDAPGRANDVLVNCGNTNAVEFITKPFLFALGKNELADVALTHGDLRYIGGYEALEAALPFGKTLISPVRFRSPAYRRIADALEATPSRKQVGKRGDHLGLWAVLHPNAGDKFPQGDDNSLVLCGDFYGTRVLLLSDLGRQGQEALMERNEDLRAEIVVSGLPERGEPLCDGLLERVQPKLIIVADSEQPANKRAGAKLRGRLEGHGVPVLYTRETGAVTLTLHTHGWQFHPAITAFPHSQTGGQ